MEAEPLRVRPFPCLSTFNNFIMTKVLTNTFIKKHIAAFVMVVAVFFVMFSFTTQARAESVDDLQATIDALIAKVADLEKQLNEQSDSDSELESVLSDYSSGFQPIAGSFMKGSRDGVNGDVTKIQKCLASLGNYDDDATGFFGPLTELAVKAFQSDQGIVSSGNAWTTGFGSVGPSTRSALNNKCKSIWETPNMCPTYAPPLCENDEVVVKGEKNKNGCYTAPKCVAKDDVDEPTNEANLEASPETGQAPLLVSFTSTHGDNYFFRPSSIDGRDTLIDFGDDSTRAWIKCSHDKQFFGKCETPKKVTHVYTENGTYEVKLIKSATRSDNEETVLDTLTIEVEKSSEDDSSSSEAADGTESSDSTASSQPTKCLHNKTFQKVGSVFSRIDPVGNGSFAIPAMPNYYFMCTESGWKLQTKESSSDSPDPTVKGASTTNFEAQLTVVLAALKSVLDDAQQTLK